MHVKGAVVGTVLMISALAAPSIAFPYPLPCFDLEVRTLALDGQDVNLCVWDVPLLTEGAAITRHNVTANTTVPKADIRTLQGYVENDLESFVRAVEAPGYFSGMIQKQSGWYWLHPNGTVRFQPPTPMHTPWVDWTEFNFDGTTPEARLTISADPDFMSDWGGIWHLYALTILNNVDGAFRAQVDFGLRVVAVRGFEAGTAGQEAGIEQTDLRQVLSGQDLGISPLGYATVLTAGVEVGESWVRTSPALARPPGAPYGGPYEGTLYGATMVSVHELGHNFNQLHDPWYGDANDVAPPPVCTAYGGWHGEDQNCLEIGMWWRPVNLASAGAAWVRGPLLYGPR